MKSSQRPDGAKRELIKVMAFGTFDNFHKGHESYLRQAKKLGDYLIVIIARDQTALKVKGKLPRNSENDRLNKVISADLADRVLLGNLGDKYAVIREYAPNILALGYDQKNFTEDLKKAFPKLKIVRLAAFKPELYKSSIVNSKLLNNLYRNFIKK